MCAPAITDITFKFKPSLNDHSKLFCVEAHLASERTALTASASLHFDNYGRLLQMDTHLATRARSQKLPIGKSLIVPELQARRPGLPTTEDPVVS